MTAYGEGTSAGAVRSRIPSVLACLLMAVGLAVVARTIESGGGADSLGVLFGLVLLAAGAVRLAVALRSRNERLLGDQDRCEGGRAGGAERSAGRRRPGGGS